MKQIGPLFFPDSDTHFQVFEDEYGGVINYQKPQRDYALGFVTDFSLAIDVGGHVGIFSRHFAQHFEQVIAYEPSPDVRECLERNVPSNVEIRAQAVSDTRGTLMLSNVSAGNSGGAFLSHTGDGTIEVPVVRIDDLRLERLGLLKIDVQGEDFRVLYGARKTIRRCKTVVLIEEKKVEGTDSVDHIVKTNALMKDLGATMRDKIGADRVFTFD